MKKTIIEALTWAAAQDAVRRDGGDPIRDIESVRAKRDASRTKKRVGPGYSPPEGWGLVLTLADRADD